MTEPEILSGRAEFFEYAYSALTKKGTYLTQKSKELNFYFSPKDADLERIYGEK
jgi:hypothetical protein